MRPNFYLNNVRQALMASQGFKSITCLRVILFAVTSLLLSACQTPPLHVYSTMNDKVDFSQFETFAVNSTLISDSLLLNELTRNISAVLSEKGYQKESTEKADLEVVYHLNIKEGDKLKQASIPVNGLVYTRPMLESVYEAQILVNVINTKSKMVIWKATSSRDLTNIDTSNIDEKKVHARMLELFESFPSN